MLWLGLLLCPHDHHSRLPKNFCSSGSVPITYFYYYYYYYYYYYFLIWTEHITTTTSAIKFCDLNKTWFFYEFFYISFARPFHWSRNLKGSPMTSCDVKSASTTVEPRLTATSVIQSPRCYGHFFLDRQNGHTFPHKKKNVWVCSCTVFRLR